MRAGIKKMQNQRTFINSPERTFFLLLVTVAAFPVGKSADPLCEGLTENEYFLFAHEYDCSLYYECYNGEKTLFGCDNGLYFNAVTKSCDFPEVSGCINREPTTTTTTTTTTTIPTTTTLTTTTTITTPTTTTVTTTQRPADPLCEGVLPGKYVLFPHENNCSLYYQCYNGDKTLLSCENGLYFNNNLQSCDSPETSGCNQLNFLCIGKDLDYLPHPTDCTKYIECYLENSYLMSCQWGYHFDAILKQCVHPDQSSCGKTPTTEPPTHSTPHPLCWGVRPNQTVLLRYDGDCNKYWKCVGAVLSEETCPAGLLFDTNRQMCDFEEFVNCDDSTKIPGNGTTSAPHPTTHGTVDPRCADIGSSTWPHPLDCNVYIQCLDGSSFEMRCPSGLYYSDLDKMCEDPQTSGCGKPPPTTIHPGSTSTLPPNWTIDPDCRNSNNYLFPYPGDCTKYIECANSQKVEMDCPPGLWFNPTLTICDYPYQAGCEWGW